MSLTSFHPLIREWFVERFGEPTDPQRWGWPPIEAGRHTLIAAPTGSGKTLAAFLVCVNRLWQDGCHGKLADAIQVIYVSPLKALSNDIDRNLQTPLSELVDRARSANLPQPNIRTALRTGDTPASKRQAMLRTPPHILVTTPESLYLLLTSAKSRELLKSVRTVIVDEIHALARDKRGSHLALSLERLEAICDRPPVRIGLSATQRPIDEIARFLTGSTGQPVEIVDIGHIRNLDLAIEVPPAELSAVCSHEQWATVFHRLGELITAHRSTLIFVNTRRMAERIAHHLRETLGEEAVASHHGSMSREARLSAEQRLKSGGLQAIVATASLEMGIDIGYIDLVCQIGSPRSIATFLQRIGRSGHSLRATPKGRLFPLTRDELVECLALIRAVRRGTLDQIEIPVAPLDILAQQLIAEVACGPRTETELFDLARRAWPYRDLTREQFDQVVQLISQGMADRPGRGAYVHHDRINQVLHPRRGARLAAITSGGAIPDAAEYRVVTADEETLVGTVDEDFAIESMAGDVFLLGNASWRVRHVRAGQVVVTDAEGAPSTVPFWLGEGPGRTIELSDEISRLREEIARWLAAGVPADEMCSRLHDECGAPDDAARQAVAYIEAQIAAVGFVPTGNTILFERFFDESGGMQLVIHAPLGQRINRAWGLALRKRFCRSFDFELQAAATDNGLLLSLSPQHSFPIDALFKMLGPHNAEQLLQQAVLAQPMFQVRWRWNVTRSLAVLRRNGGRRVPPHMIRFRSDDLLASVFPETVGCLENHHGDVAIPDHPLVRQTMHDCLHEAMDVAKWLQLLGAVGSGEVRFLARDTREPSPFCHSILNASPYAFLDGAPLEERRTRAVAARRSFVADDVRDLAQLDPATIDQVRQAAWPDVRNPEELHDVLHSMVVLPENELDSWSEYGARLVATGRALWVRVGSTHRFLAAMERWPMVRALYSRISSPPAVTSAVKSAVNPEEAEEPEGGCCAPETQPCLPPELDSPVDPLIALVDTVRGRMAVRGPVTAAQLAAELALGESQVSAALESLESSGLVMRGHFQASAAAVEWCDRRLLARIHRLTLDGLRQKIKPVSRPDFVRFLARKHRLDAHSQWAGPVGVREAIAALQGFEAPAGSWEKHLLAGRVADYDPQWLDHLFLTGEVMWGRLRQPRLEDRSGRAVTALTRVVPITLLLREDLSWLGEVPSTGSPANPAHSASGSVPPKDELAGNLRGHTLRVLQLLTTRGALFLQELRSLAGLLPAHLDEALRELAALGLATCDGFAAVRSFVAERRSGSRRGVRVGTGLGTPAGRWSRFPGINEPEAPALNRNERWCQLLLHRYGVVFRDLLARENCAPSWTELVPVFRRLELRGAVRGGRFVADVAGEQYASDGTVEQLREMRDTPTDGSWFLLSAADPVNLCGILDKNPRVPGTHRNALIVQDGQFVAAIQARQVDFLAVREGAPAAEMRRALQTGRRRQALHVREWQENESRPLRPRSLNDAPSRTLRGP